MDRILEGVYWSIGENEYVLQVSFHDSCRPNIINSFSDWNAAGEGNYPNQNKIIMIFKKKFQNHLDLEVFIKELQQNNNISLKEVK